MDPFDLYFMPEFIQIFSTMDKRETADRISRVLLNAGVAACVQVIGPIHSSYWWMGRVRRSKEWLCLIKARSSDYGIIEQSIKKVHPYETPEILAAPVLKGNPDYLSWIRKETDRGKEESSVLIG